MIDVKFLRENPELVKAKVALKHFECDIDAVLALDAQRRKAVADFEDARAAQNAASKAMAELPKGSPEFKEKLAEMKEVSKRVKDLEAAAAEIDKHWKQILLTIPNMPDDSVPVGKSAEDNVTVYTWGDVTKIKNAVPHWDLPYFEKMLDFRRGVKVTGAGFPFYVGDMARLVRALLAFFLDEARKNGYRELMCPIMVNAASATATGQLPDKEGQMYHATVDNFYLVPTAEVPVTNIYRDVILEKEDFPVKMTAYTPCFRREAGSYGKDVRGLNRLHQFDKVEIVQLSLPEKSYEALDGMVAHVESIVKALGLPYRILRLCGGDMSFTSALTYDFEVYSEAQKRWLEVSSVSNFESFQANRLKLRYKDADKKTRLAHTLNGSSLALPRIVAALLENNQTPDGIRIPEALIPYTGFDMIK